MIFFNHEVKESTIPGAGKGLFTLEPIRAKNLLGFALNDSCELITEEDLHEFGETREAGSSSRTLQTILNSAVFHLPGIYSCNPSGKSTPFQYANHSKKDSLFCFMGWVFALVDIEAGSELFINYSWDFYPRVDSRGAIRAWMKDGSSGEEVRGVPDKAKVDWMLKTLAKILDTE